MNYLKQILIRLALGKQTYKYMCRTLKADPRLPRCHEADIIIRQDGIERRIEADWLKTLSKIVIPQKKLKTAKELMKKYKFPEQGEAEQLTTLKANVDSFSKGMK